MTVVEGEDVPPTKPAKSLGVRHFQFVLYFFATLLAFGVRVNMSVGIIAMMEPNSTDSNIPTYPEWKHKETILSSFFWGYVVFQIGAGQLSERFGPKWFMAGTMFVNSLFTLVIPPLAATWGEGGVILCRIMQGLSQGFLFPSTHNLMGKWAPLSERSRVAGFVYTAGPLGTVVALPITGFLANSRIGWPSAFYIYGALGILWVLVWAWFGADTPSKHKSISEEEKKYIECGTSSITAKKLPTPWKAILTSLPFYAILVAHTGQNWGFFTLLTEIPSYLRNRMGYDITSNSLLSALPYLALWLLNFAFSPIADFLIVKKYLSVGNTRKLFHSIGVVLPAISLTWLGFIDHNEKNLAIGLLIAAVAFNAGVYSGYNVNHIDLSPNHAGTLMGLTNTVSNLFSIGAPLALTATGRSNNDPILWRIIFCVAAVVYVLSDVFFLIFGSGEVQTWNDENNETEQQNSENA